MNQKDLLKWGLVALGVYLIYEYIQKNGGLAGIFGTTAAAGTGPQCPAGQVINAAGQCITIPAAGTGTTPANQQPTQPAYQPPKPPQVDLTGLTVVPDVNDSLTGTVSIDGVPTRLSIISASGAIYDATGNDVTNHLQGEGVDIVALRTAFLNAPKAGALSGLAAVRYTPSWLM